MIKWVKNFKPLVARFQKISFFILSLVNRNIVFDYRTLFLIKFVECIVFPYFLDL